MSKRGKEKKAENVENRRLQMEEAVECLAIKQAAENQMAIAVKRQPVRCSFQHCLRYVDASCTVCPYCGTPLEKEKSVADRQSPALQHC